MMSSDYYRDIFKMLYKDKVRTAQEAEQQNLDSRILVPLSFGSSSLVLLDILNDTLTEQSHQHKGKTGFSVDVLTCYRHEEDLVQIKENINSLRERYQVNKGKINFHVLSLDSFFNSCGNELQQIVLHYQEFSSMGADVTNFDTIDQLLKKCPNRNSSGDLLYFITRHVVKKYTLQHGYKAILWGHSMTRLADEILSLIHI